MRLADEVALGIEDADRVAGPGLGTIQHVRVKDPGMSIAKTIRAFAGHAHFRLFVICQIL